MSPYTRRSDVDLHGNVFRESIEEILS